MIFSTWIPAFIALLSAQHVSSSTNRVREVSYDLVPDKLLQLPQGMEQKSTEVDDAMDCMFSCTSKDWCRSINFKIKPLENGLHVCELLSSDRFTNGTTIKQDNGFRHYSKKDKCRQEKPCRNGGQCIYYDDIDDYQCICREGTTGKDCEIIASSDNVFAFNSSVFVLVTENKTWEDGRLHCKTFGADLASFHSELESKTVLETLLNSSRKVEFGAHESYLVKLALDGSDKELIPKNGAKYESTDQGNALYLDGADDFVLVPRFSFYDKSFTFGVWVKLAVSKDHTIFGDDNGYAGQKSFNFIVNSENRVKVIMWFSGAHTAVTYSYGSVPINQWCHIGLSFDKDTHRVKIYLNGSLDISKVGSSVGKSRLVNNPTYYWIGKVGYSSQPTFSGWMKGLLMVPRILEDSEIKALVGGRSTWIGLNDKANEGALEWSDGTPLTYKDLKQLNTEPKDCGLVTLVENFPEKWSMRDCQEESFFVCRK